MPVLEDLPFPILVVELFGFIGGSTFADRLSLVVVSTALASSNT